MSNLDYIGLKPAHCSEVPGNLTDRHTFGAQHPFEFAIFEQLKRPSAAVQLEEVSDGAAYQAEDGTGSDEEVEESDEVGSMQLL